MAILCGCSHWSPNVGMDQLKGLGGAGLCTLPYGGSSGLGQSAWLTEMCIVLGEVNPIGRIRKGFEHTEACMAHTTMPESIDIDAAVCLVVAVAGGQECTSQD